MNDRLNPGDELAMGSELTAGDARLAFQGDGNLVLYVKRGGNWTPRWDSKTFGQRPAATCVMQGDGNLVLYDAHREAVWASRTHGHPGASAVLQEDENFVIYAPGGQAIWASNTWVGAPTRAPFDHARDGFRFENGFADADVMGVKQSGLCGGMTWAVLDYLRAGRRPPTTTSQPPNGTPLCEFIEGRQLNSVTTHLIAWTGQILNPDDRAIHHWSTHDEWRKLRTAIDGRNPVPIGLGRYLDASANHQVLATGYRDGKGEKWIYCLDPNHKGVETTIHLRPGGLHWFDDFGEEYRGFFVCTGYTPVAPPPRDGFNPETASDARAFDAGFYLRVYDDLRQVFGGDASRARQHWLDYGIVEHRRASTILDPTNYLNRYSDLRAAFGPEGVDAAITHWIRHGIAEGRRSSREFDVAWYLSHHADLVAAFGASDYPRAVQHWLDHGLREGRRSSADFDVGFYLGSHPDLVAAFGAGNHAAAFEHWLRHGRAEGRRAVP